MRNWDRGQLRGEHAMFWDPQPCGGREVQSGDDNPQQEHVLEAELVPDHPPSNATLMEKTWSMVKPAVSAGWTCDSSRAIFFMYIERAMLTENSI